MDLLESSRDVVKESLESLQDRQRVNLEEGHLGYDQLCLKLKVLQLLLTLHKGLLVLLDDLDGVLLHRLWESLVTSRSRYERHEALAERCDICLVGLQGCLLPFEYREKLIQHADRFRDEALEYLL